MREINTLRREPVDDGRKCSIVFVDISESEPTVAGNWDQTLLLQFAVPS